MESLLRKKIFIVLFVILIIAGIVMYKRKGKSSENKLKIDKDKIPAEVLEKVISTHSAELSKAENFEDGASEFPLMLGSDGDSVKRLQRALGISESGKLDDNTIAEYKRILEGMGIEDLDRVSEASLILIEAYADRNNDKDYAEGDVIVSNGRMGAQRVNVKRGSKGNIIKLQPTKDYKGFSSGEKIGVLAKKINDDKGLIKTDFGDFYLIQFKNVKKK
jgi:hypothetical protein